MKCPKCGYGTVKGYDFMCRPCQKKSYATALSDHQQLPARPKVAVKAVELIYGKNKQ